MTTNRRPLTVMQLETDPARGVLNPYTKLLADSLPSERIRTRYFRWQGVLTDDFDVLHVHWPEFYIRHRTLAGRLFKAVFLSLFLLRITLTRKPVVRTVHNLKPHEAGSWIEERLLDWLERRTVLWVVLNETTPTPDPSRTVLIPHGHYREWYPVPTVEQVPGRLLSFGVVRPYKGLDDLVTSFRDVPPSEALTLRICGRPESAEAAARVEELVAGDARIGLDLRFVPDEELAAQLVASEIVVLPYREIHNSGAALLALSFNRPVLVRDSPTTRLLSNEFGDAWIYRFEGELSAEVLRRGVAHIRAAERDAELDMSSRDWAVLALDLADAYERAAGATRRQRLG